MKCSECGAETVEDSADDYSNKAGLPAEERYQERGATVEQYIDAKKLTGFLSISRASLYRLMKQGLPYLKVGHSTRFIPGEVESWLRRDELEFPKRVFVCVECDRTEWMERNSVTSETKCAGCGKIGTTLEAT